LVDKFLLVNKLLGLMPVFDGRTQTDGV
jgi:hypothetical protein